MYIYTIYVYIHHIRIHMTNDLYITVDVSVCMYAPTTLVYIYSEYMHINTHVGLYKMTINYTHDAKQLLFKVMIIKFRIMQAQD